MKKLNIKLIAILTIVFCLAAQNTLFAQASRDTSGYAPVNGIKMYYKIYGHGQPLVLIHGGGSTIQSTFGRIIPQLARDNRLIAVELQNHGRSGFRDVPETFEQDADDVAALLKYLKIDKASFFGFSNGGNTAMQIGIRHPAMVNKLVIASAFYKRDGMVPGFFEGMENATLSNNLPPALKTAFLKVNPDTAKLRIMFEKDSERMISFKDWSHKDMRAIKAPALVINGDRDFVTSRHAVEMSQLIPHARLMILPGTHGSYISESGTQDKTSKIPEMTVEVINEFLHEKL